MNRKFLFVLLLSGAVSSAYGQSQVQVIDGEYYEVEEDWNHGYSDYTMDMPSPTVRDRVWNGDPNVGDHQFTRQPVRYTPVREADVMWSKRIWRRIDLRQKLNHPLYFPLDPLANRKSLFDVLIYNTLYESTITAYDPGALGDSDDFSLPMTKNEVENRLIAREMVEVEDLDGNMVEQEVKTQIEAKDIVYYVIKEDWFFDKQRSVMDVRILGIAPVRAVYNSETGDFKGYQTLFWFYFPEARRVLAQEPAFNRFNDSERRSFDEIFAKRMFGSVIIKESNVYDRGIAEYKTGLNALLEAEGIKEKMFNFEQDMWSW